MLQKTIEDINKLSQQQKNLIDRYRIRLDVFQKDYDSKYKQTPGNQYLQKIREVYTICNNAVMHLQKNEEALFRGRNFVRTSIANAKISKDKKNQIDVAPMAVLRWGYDTLNTLCPRITSYAFNENEKRIIAQIAEAYAVVSEIHRQATTIGNNVDKKFLQDKAKDEAEILRYVRNFSTELEENKRKLAGYQVVLLNELKKISLLSPGKCGFEKMPKLASNHLSPSIVLGRSTNIKSEWLSLDDFNYCIKIGNNAVGLTPDEASRALAKTATYDKVLLSGHSGSYKYNFAKDLNAYITYPRDLADHNGLWKILRCITAKFIQCYPGTDKTITAIHDKSVGSGFVSIMSDVAACESEGALLFCKNNTKLVDTADDMGYILKRLATSIDERNALLSKSTKNYSNIIEYNIANADNAQPLRLVFIKDVDIERHRFAEIIGNIATFGPRAGIYTIMLNDESTAKTNRELLARYTDLGIFTHNFTYKNDGYLYTENLKINCTEGADNLNPKYFEEIRNLINKSKQSLDFLKFQASIPSSSGLDNSKKLVIPVGKNGAEVVNMVLDSETVYAHAMIEGTTGTGKTAFLHNMILSAAYRYSPEELEIWIFDFMRGGIDFEPYKKLKHVKYMALNTNQSDSLDLLDHIDSITSQRGPIKGTNNPRVLIVIDEYHVLPREGQVKLEQQISQVRKFGFSFILSSQDAPFDDINKNVSHKFSMYKIPINASNELSGFKLVREESVCRKLSKTNRMVAYDGQGGACAMKFAFAGNAFYSGDKKNVNNLDMNKGIGNVIRVINDRYPCSHYIVPTILGNSDVLDMRNLPEDFSIFNLKESSLRVLLGESNISAQPRYYRMDSKNRLLILFGDKHRATSVESLFVKAFEKITCKDQPLVYYLNFGSYEDNILKDYATSHPENFSQTPRDIPRVLSNVHKRFVERDEAFFYDGVEFKYPILLIVHCAGNTSSFIRRMEKANRSTQSQSFGRSTDADMYLDMSMEELMKYREKGKKALRDDTFSSGFDVHTEKDLSIAEMLNDISQAEADCNIKLILHFEDSEQVSENRMYPTEFSSFKDCIIIPSPPQEGEEISGENEYNTMRALGINVSSGNFAEEYVKKISSKPGEEEQGKNNTKYLILIDEHKPSLYMPYEYID